MVKKRNERYWNPTIILVDVKDKELIKEYCCKEGKSFAKWVGVTIHERVRVKDDRRLKG